MKKFFIKGILAVLLLVIGFSIAKFKLFPYKYIEKGFKVISSYSASEIEYASLQDDLVLASLFKDPIIDKSTLIYNKINSIDDLYNVLNKELIIEDSLQLIYDKISILRDSTFFVYDSIECVAITYKYNNCIRSAYSFKKGQNRQKACLFIPGSGHNQSSEIVLEKRSNYHDGLQNLLKSKNYTSYTYIKPNEDILAYHNGVNKLNTVGYVNWYLSQGGSYSLGYIVHTVAFAKYLKNNYDFTLVAGLSQGGLASLVTSILSEPDLSIVSSGYSILFDKIEPSGHNQMIIPHLNSITRSTNVFEKINQSKTNYIFTYGKSETSIYEVEANFNLTKKFLALPNVDFIFHEGGHCFPIKELESYIN